MKAPTLASRQQIINWADTTDSKPLFPELIRRLIRETSTTAEIDVPAHEGIGLEGYDGVIVSSQQNGHVPSGLSVWEFGVTNKTVNKANEDFEKRANNPLVENPSIVTFVFVSPRPFAKRQKWANEKQTLGPFGTVKALGIDDLTEWLSTCPATHLWLSEQIGVHVNGVVTAIEHWENWKKGEAVESLAFTFTPEMLLAGRQAEVAALKQSLTHTPHKILLESNEAADIIPFVLAAMDSWRGDPSKLGLVNRTIILQTIEAFRYYAKSTKELILVPIIHVESSDLTQALKNKHHLILQANGSQGERLRIILNKLDAGVLEKIFKQTSYTPNAGYYALRLSSSLTAFRRTVIGHDKVPDWSQSNDAGLLAKLVMIGEWQKSNEADKALVSRICKLTYDEVDAKLASLSNNHDDLLEAHSTIWRFKSKEDVWHLLHKIATKGMVGDFCNVAFEVITNVEPTIQFSQSANAGDVNDNQGFYSATIKRSIAESLALYSMLHKRKIEDKLVLENSDLGEMFETSILKIFDWGFSSKASCSHLSSYFRVLSVAMPREFLNHVHKDLLKIEPFQLALFEGKDMVTHKAFKASHLLSSLNKLGRSREYTPQVARSLIKLLEKAPDTSINPSPLSTLKNIFRVWQPRVSGELNDAKRMLLLDKIITESPDSGWNLLVRLLPDHIDSVDEGVNLSWEMAFLTIPDAEIEHPDLALKFQQVVKLAMNFAGTDHLRWHAILSMQWMRLLPFEEFIKEVLDTCLDSSASWTDEEKEPNWRVLYSVYSDCLEFLDLSNRLKQPIIGWILNTMNSLTPKDVRQTVLHYFSVARRNELGSKKTDNFKDYREKEDALLKRGAMLLFQSLSIDELMKYSNSVNEPDTFGRAMALAGINLDICTLLQNGVEALSQNERQALWSYVFNRFSIDGDKWLMNLVSNAKMQSLSPEILTWVLLSLPYCQEIEYILKNAQVEVLNAYVSKPNLFKFNRIHNINWLLQQYIDKGFAHWGLFLINCSTYDLHGINPAILIQLLLKNDFRYLSDCGLNSWDFKNIIIYLHDTSLDLKAEVIQVELKYFKFCKPESFDDPQFNLWIFEELASSPEFFALLVSWAYIQDAYVGKRYEIPESELVNENLAELGYDILNSWIFTLGEFGFSFDYFKMWYSKTLLELSSRGRSSTGLEALAKVLAQTPNKNGEWPHPQLLTFFESILSSFEFIQSVAFYKYRPTTIKYYVDKHDAKDELSMALRYSDLSNDFNISYPNVSNLMREISKLYSEYAKWFVSTRGSEY